MATVTLTANLARASGLDAGNASMRKACRTRWNATDRDVATTTTNKLMLHVPFEHGGLGGIELSASQIEDLGLTTADVYASGNRVLGHNGGPSMIEARA